MEWVLVYVIGFVGTGIVMNLARQHGYLMYTPESDAFVFRLLWPLFLPIGAVTWVARKIYGS